MKDFTYSLRELSIALIPSLIFVASLLPWLPERSIPAEIDVTLSASALVVLYALGLVFHGATNKLNRYLSRVIFRVEDSSAVFMVSDTAEKYLESIQHRSQKNGIDLHIETERLAGKTSAIIYYLARAIVVRRPDFSSFIDRLISLDNLSYALIPPISALSISFGAFLVLRTNGQYQWVLVLALFAGWFTLCRLCALSGEKYRRFLALNVLRLASLLDLGIDQEPKGAPDQG